jgi:proline iminopeptidase
LFQVPEQAVSDSKAIIPLTVLINPVIEPLSEEKVMGWEGCVSLPGLVGEVPRYKHIRYSYKTLEGKIVTSEACDFHAKVIQHEVDHLDGILYLDRMKDMTRLYFEEEFREFVVKPAIANKDVKLVPVGEFSFAVPGGKIWYKVSGNGRGVPLVVLHGGPGMSSIYLKVFDELGNDRQIVRYDQLGSGNSDKITDKTLFTIDRFVKELELLRVHLGVEKWHVLGHSWGTVVALEYYRAYPERVSSLIFGSQCLDVKGWVQSTKKLLTTLPVQLQDAVKKAESTNNYDDPMYKEAMDQFYSLYIWRHPVKADLDIMLATCNTDMYAYMWGPSEFTVTGTLKDYNPFSFLSQIKVPTMFTVGEFDEIDPAMVKKLADKVPGAKYVMFTGSGHITTWDARDENLKVVREFLQSVDTLKK